MYQIIINWLINKSTNFKNISFVKILLIFIVFTEK